MYNLDQAPGRTAVIDKKEFLFFSGYNYLGMNFVQEFLALLQEGVGKYGWLFPSSRVSNTRLTVYEECEALLSEITGTEETVLFASGFSAGHAAVLSQESRILNAPGAHPAIRGQRAGMPDFKAWSRWLVEKVNSEESGEYRGIAADSLNPLTATIYDFSFLTGIRKELSVIIDDSHGIGLTGKKGSGASAIVPRLPNIEYLFSYSLSKAFGITAGAVSCTRSQASVLRALPEYAAVTPPLPAQAYAFVKGQHLYARQRQKLSENIRYFAECLKDIKGVHYHPDLPVFVLPPDFDESLLAREGIVISSFAYPDPSGDKLNRIVVNALHTRQDLDYAASCLHKYCI